MILAIQRNAILFCALALTAACGGGGSSGGGSAGGGSAIAAQYQGIWTAPGYGRVLDIGASSLRLLDFTSEYCLSIINESGIGTADIEALFRLQSDQLEWYSETGTAEFGAPGVQFTKQDQLPDSCSENIDPRVGEAGYQRDAARDLELFAQLIEEYSVYPELRQIDALTLYAEQASTINSESIDEALVEALFNIAEPFADIHMTVESSVGLIKILNKPSLQVQLAEEWLEQEGVTPPLTEPEIDAINAYIEEQTDLDRETTLSYAESDIRSAGNDLLTWFISQNVGYLAIDAMIGFGDIENNADELQKLETALDAALNDLRDTSALVIDVRRNGGGKDFLSLAIASRFMANETLAYAKQARLGSGRSNLRNVYVSPRGDFQYLAPVFLLTSPTTASAAEAFTLAMREAPQVTIIGEATQGGFSDQLDKSLTNGWPVSVANEFYLSADGDWFEGTGVPVDVEVPQFTREARLENVDLGIEAVIDILTNE